MGRPFKNELEELNKTYEWACSFDVSEISKTLKRSWHHPLFTVGSGGSFSAAEYHASLHRSLFETVAQAVTPLEMIEHLPRDGKASVWLMSASGNNIDVRRAFKHAALLEPAIVAAIVGSENSKLGELADKFQFADIFAFDLPAGKDGFLATNSLVSFIIILYRAYCLTVEIPTNLPTSLQNLILNTLSSHSSLDDLFQDCSNLWPMEHIQVVYSTPLKAAAIDIESKFVEAGLGSVLISDIRNFAHGRHHWFDKQKDKSGILFISSKEDKEICNRTLNLLPDEIPNCHINLNATPGIDSIVGIILSLFLTGEKGVYRNIDPGKPGVPQYGSKIYRLSAKAGFRTTLKKDEVAILRKTRAFPPVSVDETFWKQSYFDFSKRLKKAIIGGIVLDYDGTVVDTRHRFDPPIKEMTEQLIRLLDAGILVGFATGRGKSIREALQSENIIPREYWDQIIIGYYNGSDISVLSDNNSPDGKERSCPDLTKESLCIQQLSSTKTLECTFEERLNQITVETKSLLPEGLLWQMVYNEAQNNCAQLKITRSSHSIDILKKDVTKCTVIEKMTGKLLKNRSVLSIGDRGEWPGNDFDLLSSELSLSVDEVSTSSSSCWNLCPPGIKGPYGTVHYLKRLVTDSGIARFK